MLTIKSAPKSEFLNAIVPGNGQIEIKVQPKNITRYGIKEKKKKRGLIADGFFIVHLHRDMNTDNLYLIGVQ